MAGTQNNGARTLGLAVLGVALGLGGGYLLFGQAKTPSSQEVAGEADGGSESDTTGGATLSSAEARVKHLEEELGAERDMRRALQEQVDKLKASMGEGEAGNAAGSGDGAATANAPKKGARYTFSGTGEVAGSLDYTTAAKSLVKLPSLIKELMDGWARGEQIPAVAGDIQRWNGPLVQAALAINNEGKLGGSGVNGAFTHPAVQVNFIYATLKESGKPLDERQEGELQKIGDRFVEEEAARQANLREDGYVLEALIEECALKDRFYASVDAMLSTEQRDVLHNDEVRGRLQVDMFNSGLVWAQHTGVLPFSDQDRSALARLVEARVAPMLGGDATAIEAVRRLANEFVASLPDESLQIPVTPGMVPQMGVPVAHVERCAKATLVMQKGLSDALPADHPLQPEIRKSASVILPLYKAPE